MGRAQEVRRHDWRSRPAEALSRTADERYRGPMRKPTTTHEWQELDQLEARPDEALDRLDWVAKKKLMLDFMEAEPDVMGRHPAFTDLEYHNVNRKPAFTTPEQRNDARNHDLKIIDAIANPPHNTPQGRGIVNRQTTRPKLARLRDRLGPRIISTSDVLWS